MYPEMNFPGVVFVSVILLKSVVKPDTVPRNLTAHPHNSLLFYKAGTSPSFLDQ